mgnify:CR=1 FL=1
MQGAGGGALLAEGTKAELKERREASLARLEAALAAEVEQEEMSESERARLLREGHAPPTGLGELR